MFPFTFSHCRDHSTNLAFRFATVSVVVKLTNQSINQHIECMMKCTGGILKFSFFGSKICSDTSDIIFRHHTIITWALILLKLFWKISDFNVTDCSRAKPINQSINQSINPSINQLINQSINPSEKSYPPRPPALRLSPVNSSRSSSLDMKKNRVYTRKNAKQTRITIHVVVSFPSHRYHDDPVGPLNCVRRALV